MECKGTKNFGIGGSVFFGLNVEAVDDVEEGVAGQCVVAGFGAALGVDFVGYVAELAEYVESVENEGEFAFENAFADAGVPDQMIVVEATVGIAAAAVHGNVGADAPVVGQVGGAEGQAIVEVDGIDGNEAGHARRRAAPFGVAEHIDREPRGCATVYAQFLGKLVVPHQRAGVVDEVDGVVEAIVRGALNQPHVVAARLELPPHVGVEVPVAVDVDRAVGCNARGHVVGHALGHAVAENLCLGAIIKSHPTAELIIGA